MLFVSPIPGNTTSAKSLRILENPECDGVSLVLVATTVSEGYPASAPLLLIVYLDLILTSFHPHPAVHCSVVISPAR